MEKSEIKELLKMQNRYGVERQEIYRNASDSIDYLIMHLQSLKDKIDWAKTAEPNEKVNIKPLMLEENRIQIIRNQLIDADKCNEVLEVLKEILEIWGAEMAGKRDMVYCWRS